MADVKIPFLGEIPEEKLPFLAIYGTLVVLFLAAVGFIAFFALFGPGSPAQPGPPLNITFIEPTPIPTPTPTATPAPTATPTPRPKPTPRPTPTPVPFLKWCDESGACFMGKAPDPTPIPTPTPSPTPVVTSTPRPTPPVRIVGGIPVGRVNFGSVGGTCNATLADAAERYYLEHCGGIIADRHGLGDSFSLSWCVLQPGNWAEECRHCVMERECYNITEYNSTYER